MKEMYFELIETDDDQKLNQIKLKQFCWNVNSMSMMTFMLKTYE